MCIRDRFRWGEKHLQYSVANIVRTICTKIYQNRPGFVDHVTKTFDVFLSSQFQLLFTYKTQTIRQCNDIIQMSWKKTFKLLYRKFIQDTVYQLLSESTGFCGRYDKNIWCVFRSTVYIRKIGSLSASVNRKKGPRMCLWLWQHDSKIVLIN